MQKAFLFAVPAVIIGLAACNKTSQEKANETSANIKQETSEAVQDIKENAQDAAANVKEESREAVANIKENANEAIKDIKQEAGQAGANIREGADVARSDAKKTSDELRAEGREAGTSVKTEARQTGRDISEALGMDQARTKADGKLNESIRAALNANKTTARDDDDISLETDNGKVQLKGTVTTEDMKKEIASVVRKVAGTTNVTDNVKVADRIGAGSND
jgi:osmotically-inducible protein OsmY